MVSVKTSQILANYHDNNQTIFHIPRKVFLNTMRLHNLGFTSNHTSEKTQPTNGMGGLIQNIYLYANGNLPLGQSLNAHSMLSFNALRKSNAQNRNVESALTGCQWAFDIEKYDNSASILKAIIGFSLNDTSTYPIVRQGAGVGNLGILPLMRCFGFLQRDSIIPPIESLRLVIQWRTDNPLNALRGNTPDDTVITVNQPILVVDEVMDSKVINAVSNKSITIPYMEYERDTVYVDVVADGVKQLESLRFNGFNGKLVGRFILQNQFAPTTTATTGANRAKQVIKADDGSVAMYKEVWNPRINGANKFLRNGVDSQNRKLDLLSQTYGDVLVPNGVQYSYMTTANDMFEGSDATNVKGRVSWGAWEENSRIESCEIIYERTGSTEAKIADTMGSKAFNMSLYGEVHKVARISNGQVNISYA